MPSNQTTRASLRSFTLRNFIEEARKYGRHHCNGAIAKLYASQLH